MYLLLIKVGRFFKGLSPVFTAGVALLLAISYGILMKLGINQNYDIYYKTLTVLPAGFFLLWAGAKFLTRRSHLKNKDIKYITKYFRTSEQFGQIFDHCLHIDKGSLKLCRKLAAKDCYKWPESEAELEKLSAINAAAFRGTPWAGDPAEKLTRNLAMWHKNPKSFLMIMGDGAAQERQPLFFSHILPLSDHGYHHYFETAESGDNDFNPQWMAEPGEHIKGLLLFTIARDPDQEGGKKDDDSNKLPEYLYTVAYHIQAMLEDYPAEKYTTLYFQNSEKKFKRLAELSGFKKSRLLTHDEETVYVVSVDNSLS
ncbi:hypothetical protein MNBD_ALPHA02-410 [hydrothermal vent metagenome]|uniref:Uncharacterized protein n=1 Tax=hydrothermal vent metagenome TaxID=652676 RepID=A0A3B0RUH6_9ZZZZ